MKAWRLYASVVLLALALSSAPCSAAENATQPFPGAAAPAPADANVGAAAPPSDQPADAREPDLLKWALKHVDPEALHAQAEAAKAAARSGGAAADADAAERRARAAELLRAVSDLPSEADLMGGALELLGNASAPAADRGAALEALAVLVEPIDNADHLLKIEGATGQLVGLLGAAPGLEAAAARVLGVAASNNPPFAAEVVARHPEVVARLVQLLGGAADDTVAAAVFAAGQLLRGSPAARGLWAQASGGSVLVGLVAGGPQVSPRSRRRALALAADLQEIDPGAEDGGPLAAALLSLLREQTGLGAAVMDLDMVEKALLGVAAVQGRNRAGRAALREGGSEAALAALAAALRGPGAPEYAADVAALAEKVARERGTVGRACSSGCGGGAAPPPDGTESPHDEL